MEKFVFDIRRTLNWISNTRHKLSNTGYRDVLDSGNHVPLLLPLNCNPIEKLWKIVKLGLIKPRNMEELWEKVQKAWYLIPNSMWNLCRKGANKGFATKFNLYAFLVIIGFYLLPIELLDFASALLSKKLHIKATIKLSR